jgi:hypothetical protein
MRRRIADFLEETADTRDERATRDWRHAGAGDALRALADEVLAMNPLDPSLAVLESMHERWGLDDTFSPGQDGARLVGELGVARPTMTGAKLVEALAVAAVGDSSDPELEGDT